MRKDVHVQSSDCLDTTQNSKYDSLMQAVPVRYDFFRTRMTLDGISANSQHNSF